MGRFLKRCQPILLNPVFWFAFVLIWGLDSTLGDQQNEWGNSLFPDVETYQVIAKAMTSPYDTDSREPVWIWFVKVATFLFGESESVMRGLGLTVFLITSILFFFTLLRLSGSRLCGLLGMAAFMQNDALAFNAIQCLRDQGVLLGLVGLALFIFNNGYHPHRWRPWQQVVGAVLFSCILIGTRITFFAPLIGFLIVALLTRSVRVWQTLVIAIVSVLFIFPHLMNNRAKYGDAMYSANIHAVWWRNYEFVYLKKVGCEGCPTSEELKTDFYKGAPTTAFKYIFGMHPLSQVVKDTSIGLARIFGARTSLHTYITGLHGSPQYFTAYLIGVFALMASRFRWLLLLPFAVINFVPFMHQALGVPLRLFTPLSPFLLGFTALGLSLTIERVIVLIETLIANVKTIGKGRLKLVDQTHV